MTTRFCFLAVGLVAGSILVGGCKGSGNGSVPIIGNVLNSVVSAAGGDVSVQKSAPRPIVKTPVDDMVLQGDGYTALRLDSRFLIALNSLPVLLGPKGTSPGDSQAVSTGSGWAILDNGTTIAELRKIPYLKEMHAALLQRAESLLKDWPTGSTPGPDPSPKVQEAIGKFWRNETVEAAEGLQADWGKSPASPAARAAAARILVNLESQIHQASIGLDDPLVARAWAAVVSAQAHLGTTETAALATAAPDVFADQVLVSKFLGYGNEAWALGELLPPSPERMFVQKQTAEILDLIETRKTTATVRDRYLALRAQQANDDLSHTARAAMRVFTVPPPNTAVLTCMTRAATFSERANSAAYLFNAEMAALGAPARKMDMNDSTVYYGGKGGYMGFYAPLEEKLAAKLPDGPVLPRDVALVCWRGPIAWSVYTMGNFLGQNLGDYAAAKEFEKYIFRGGTPPKSLEPIVDWIMAMQKDHNPTAWTAKGLYGIITNPKVYTESTRYFSWSRLTGRGFDDPDFEVRRFALGFHPSVFDFLPESLSAEYMRDLKQAYEVQVRLANPATPENAEERLLLAVRTEDTTGFLQLIRTLPDIEPATVAKVFGIAERDKLVSNSDLVRAAQLLVERRPNDRSAIDILAGLTLDSDGENYLVQAAQKYIENSKQMDFDEYAVRCNLANALCNLGRSKEALDVTGKVLDSMQGGVILTHARVLAMNGKFGDALDQVKVFEDRYRPSAASHTRRITILLAAESYDEAAKYIAANKKNLSKSFWQSLLPIYLKKYVRPRGRPALDSAVNLIVEATFSNEAEGFPDGLVQQGDPESAILACTILAKMWGDNNVTYNLKAYQIRKGLEGREKAVEKLKASIKGGQQLLFAQYATMLNEDDVVWDVLTPDYVGRYSEFVPITHALAAMKLPDSDPRRKALLLKIANPVPGDFGITFARHILGFEDEQAAKESAVNHKLEAAYFLALKAYRDGRREDAFRWLRAVCLSGAKRDIEVHFANQIMADTFKPSFKNYVQ